MAKYSDYFIDSLVEQGYSTCFFVGGGNIMHLVESARTRLNCIAVVNEVSAGIAAEYFNVANRGTSERAFALVTAGPGLTNIITAIGSAWMESRELLVVGGQARTEFLSRGTVRQMGHQEIDGVSLVKGITKAAYRIETPIDSESIREFTKLSASGRKGPVFLEMCLDVSATNNDPRRVSPQIQESHGNGDSCNHKNWEASKPQFVELWNKAQRPLFLIGTGVSFEVFRKHLPVLEKLQIPVATSWNAIDYVDYDSEIYGGRPDSFGMRWANSVVQQADLVVTLGSRLGLQQTGFNWEQFVPAGKIIHIDIDHYEVSKTNPKLELAIEADLAEVYIDIISTIETENDGKNYADWIKFISEVRHVLPASEDANNQHEGFVNPFNVVTEVSKIAKSDWNIVPCSSGGSYTSVMQVFQQKAGQLLPNNKGLASMGYGLGGAIGVAVARPQSITVLFEGDGGFAQNLSELGTVQNRNLNIKFVISDNGGYASIRTSQRSYFEGNYIGCDSETGVGLPDWRKLFEAFGIEVFYITKSIGETPGALEALENSKPAAFILKVHVDQSFLPKLTSRIFPDGNMKSNPLHLMHPQISRELADKVFKYLPESLRYVD